MLNAGSVVAVVGARFDDSGYEQFRRAHNQARQDAARPVLGELGGDFDRTGFEQFRGELDESARAADDFAGDVGGSFDKVKLGAAAGAAAIGAVLIKGIGDALEGDELNRKLGVQLGASTKESARLGAVAGKVYAGNYGESLGEVNTAIAAVMRDVDGMSTASSARLQGFTGDVLSVATAFEVDLGGATKAVGQLMRTGLAKDSQEALDIVVAGLQNGANASDDFLDTLNEYGTQFRKLGLDGETATGLIVQGLKAGARDSDIVADAFKEFSIRALDGSETTKAGFESIGLVADDMAQTIAKGGKPAAEGLDEVLDRLRKVEDPVKRAQIATQLFGTQAEDLGDALFALDPSKAAKGIGDVAGAARNANKDLVGAKGQIAALQRTIGIWVAELIAKALPTVGRMADKVRGFVEGIRDGTGAGGRFADRIKTIGDRFADAYGHVKRNADLYKVLAVYIGAVVSGFVAFRIITSVIAAWRALTGAVIAFNLAVAANPIVAVIAVIVALGVGLVVLYKRSETARKIMDAVFNGIKGTVLAFVDVYAGMITTVLGGFQKMAEVASKLPGVGGKFKTLASEIGEVRESIDGWREGLRKGDDASKDSRAEAERQRKKIKELRDGYDDARDKQSKLKKGTDDYKDAARTARKRADELAGAIADAGTAATNARRPTRTLTNNIEGLGDAATTTTDVVIEELQAALKGMGAKPISIKVSRRGASGVFGTPDVGGLPEKAVGGIANPAGGAADDHVLVGPDGRPKALMSGTEGILNTPQMGIVDQALAIASAVTGGGVPGSLSGLWGMGLRHYAGGGILPVPGFPGERAAASVIPKIQQIAKTYNLTLTDAFGPGHKSPGHTKYGTAADFAGSDRNMDRAVAALAAAGYKVLYDGRFGSTAWPGHGPSTVAGGNAHLHVELGGKGGAIAGAAAKLLGPKITGPAGVILDAVKGAGRKLTSAGNSYLDKTLGSFPLGEHGPGVGRMNAQGLARLWKSVNGNLGNPRLMGAIGMAESSGVETAHGPPDGRGFWQIEWPVWGKTLGKYGDPYNGRANARMAGEVLKQQGLGAWVVYNTGAYRKFLNAGGLLRRAAGGLLGGLPRFNGGGNVSSTRSGSVTPRGGGSSSPYSITALRRTQGDRIDDFDNVMGNLDDAQKRYTSDDRRYGQSVEVLIDEKTGAVNVDAVNKRLAELAGLWRLRLRMIDYIEQALVIARRVVRTYSTIIGRLRRSLSSAKKKDRSGIRKSIAAYTENRGEWAQKVEDLGWDLDSARMDAVDVKNEYNEVKGTTAEDRDPDTGGAGGGLGDLDTGGDTGSSAPDPSSATPDVDQVARAEQAERASAALAQDLAAVRANVVALTSSGDIGAGGGSNAWQTVAGRGPGESGGLSAVGPTVVVEVRSFVPPTGADLARLGQAAAAGLGANPSVPSTTERVG